MGHKIVKSMRRGEVWYDVTRESLEDSKTRVTLHSFRDKDEAWAWVGRIQQLHLDLVEAVDG